MKKSIFFTSCLILVQPAAYAETTSKQHDWSVGGYASWTHYKKDTVRDNFPAPIGGEVSFDVKSDDVNGLGIVFSRNYGNISFDLGVETMESSKVSIADLSTSGANIVLLPNGGLPSSTETSNLIKLRQIPVLFTVNYHFDAGVVKPYIGIGLGYYFNDVSITNNGRAFGINEADMDNSIGYHATAGIEYLIDNDYSLFFATRYTKNEADISGTTPIGFKKDTAVMDRYDINLGLKYNF